MASGSLALFSDYHTHPQGHRVQGYSGALLEPWAKRARQIGLAEIAFTDHDRFCSGVDFDQIERLREKYPDLRIRAGIELDNDPASSAAGRKWIERHWDKLDFVLGSVHYLDRLDQMFDTVPGGASQFKDRNIDHMYTDYFRRVRDMASTGLVDCLAHLDLIKIHGHRPVRGIEFIVGETLDCIASRGLAVEISTAGWRKPVNEIYPSEQVIKLAVAKNIPVTTASDAHSHVQLADKFDQLGQKLAELAVREVCVYERHRRIVKPLTC